MAAAAVVTRRACLKSCCHEASAAIVGKPSRCTPVYRGDGDENCQVAHMGGGGGRGSVERVKRGTVLGGGGDGVTSAYGRQHAPIQERRWAPVEGKWTAPWRTYKKIDVKYTSHH